MKAVVLLYGCGPPADPGAGTPPGTSEKPPLPAILSLSVEALGASTARALVEVSAPTEVAVACALRADPREVHLVEAAGGGVVEVRLGGLLADTDYDCSAGLTAHVGPAARAALRTPAAVGEVTTATATARPGDALTGAYTVMTVRPQCYGLTNQITVLDPDGRNRWRYALPPQTNLGVEVTFDGDDTFLWGGGKHVIGAPTRVSAYDGEIGKVAFPGSSTLQFHHDGKRISDGRLLSVADDWSGGWAAFQLHLTDDAGAQTWSWDVADAVEDGWLPPGSPSNLDPHHLNWADVVLTDDGWTAYASLCFSFLVVAIDVQTGAPLWKFGYGGDFTLVDADGDALADQTDFPQCQHGLSTDGTNLLVYDNGLDRGYTRAVEYTLDPANGTAHKTWEYLDDGFFEPYHGSVDWLTPDHRRVLVAEANNGCPAEGARPSQIVELDRQEDVEVHRLVLDDAGHWIYRAHRVDGCDLFANTLYCPALAARLDELRERLDLPAAGG